MGLGAIPWSAINAYAQRYDIDDVEHFEDFAALVRAADAAYLAVMSK